MIRPLALAVLCCAALAAADGPRTVPAETAALLGELAQAAPADVVRRVDAVREPHPLLLLARAQARWRLAQEAKPESAAAPLRAGAETDFTAALRADPTLTLAHLGLAQCAAQREDWPTAARHAGLGIDPGRADRAQIAFLANLALKAGDWRVATLAAQQGLLRFHDDAVLRRIELAVLVHAGRAEDARQAVLALLAHAPGDTDLWRHLAWAAEQTNRPQESAAALEAALTTRPEDRALRQQLAAVQLGRGQPQAALATVAPLIGAAPDAATLADDRLMLLASRCAAEGGGDTGVAQARAWLALVPEARRSREQRVQMARLAVRAGDQAAARTALDALIAAGESDPAVLTWAAALAETAGDAARAEALYLRAGAGDAPAAGPATLRLAALYLKHDRRDEAGTVLAAYLARKPDDAQARALLTQLDRRR